KDAYMVKADLLDEGQQLLEILVGLSWKADDERAPQGDPGDPGADLFDEPVDQGPVSLAPHPPQDAVGRVLQRELDVLADLRLVRDDVDNLVAQVGRIRVEHPQPVDPLDL